MNVELMYKLAPQKSAHQVVNHSNQEVTSKSPRLILDIEVYKLLKLLSTIHTNIYPVLLQDPIQFNCAGCGDIKTIPLDQLSNDSEEGWMACDNCNRWSHTRCIEVQFGISDDWDNSQVPWKCPVCARESVWDDEL